MQPSLTVCRGCCCGTTKKHPDVNHDQQLNRLRAALGAERVRVVTDCLGPCERSNVMVVVPSPVSRLFGGRPAWIGQVLDEDTVTDLIAWLADGGPGPALPSAQLRDRTFPRPPGS